ncbi:hypothetical protein GJA_1600 [Janthinobacterium agaricidamnosum NBRC 102515 = DSM 9628]|uniref:Uncharacterized protein n=1 Tax=Janthinobacterium agaricidamnosum NBRC 102515 = DSM 9628 TaxID=1349767 RepID=W0V087_9BURK|nr:hypothetical protein GJA_1600 [Janthinobacterium agaricidamnosum NBRC 102515 = DSM 9628]
MLVHLARHIRHSLIAANSRQHPDLKEIIAGNYFCKNHMISKKNQRKKLSSSGHNS